MLSSLSPSVVRRRFALVLRRGELSEATAVVSVEVADAGERTARAGED
jgi:hypothetical protein